MRLSIGPVYSMKYILHHSLACQSGRQSLSTCWALASALAVLRFTWLWAQDSAPRVLLAMFFLILKHQTRNSCSLVFQNILFCSSTRRCPLTRSYSYSSTLTLSSSSLPRCPLFWRLSRVSPSHIVLPLRCEQLLNIQTAGNYNCPGCEFDAGRNQYMQASSIFKQLDTNFNTRSTNHGSSLWTGNSAVTQTKGTDAQMKSMQVKLLTMFTMAKSELAAVYQQSVAKIKRIEKALGQDSAKVGANFYAVIKQIQQQAEQKIPSMSQNIQHCLIDSLLLDHLLALLPDTIPTERALPSYKRINISQSLSSRNIGSKITNSTTVADLDLIGTHQLQNAITIKPNCKRIDNLECMAGRWEVLEVVNLEGKQISRVCSLRNFIAKSLVELNVSNNEIGSLLFMKELELPQLAILNFRKNSIGSLDGLENAKLPHLKLLDLSDNKIKKIHQLKQCKLIELIELNLSRNRIQKPEILDQCDFPKLQILNLDYNNIESISFMPTCTFYRLKILSFCYNNITELNCLGKCRLTKLEALLGYNNKIKDIQFLEKSDFPSLKQIILNNNCIKDIGVVERLQFRNLIEFDLQNNEIKPKEVLCFVTKNDQIIKAKKKFPFIQL